jgi:hypothetical protein
METTVSLMSQFPVSKKGIESFISQTKDIILSGNRDILEIAAYLAAIDSIISDLRKDNDIDASILKEAEKHGKKTFEKNGVKYTISETGVKYDYSESELWNVAKSEVEKATEKKKAIEKTIQSIKEKTILVDEFTGVTTDLHPAIKTSKTKVTVSII